MSKKLKVLASVAIAAVALMSVVSCAGPAGPAGATGPVGTFGETVPAVTDYTVLGGVQNFSTLSNAQLNQPFWAPNGLTGINAWTYDSWAGNTAQQASKSQATLVSGIGTNGPTYTVQIRNIATGTGTSVEWTKFFSGVPATGSAGSGLYKVIASIQRLTPVTAALTTSGVALQLQAAPYTLAGTQGTTGESNTPEFGGVDFNNPDRGGITSITFPTTADTGYANYTTYASNFSASQPYLWLGLFAQKAPLNYNINQVTLSPVPTSGADQDWVNAVAATLTVPTKTNSNITLPSTTIPAQVGNTVNIAWATDTPAVVSATGVVTTTTSAGSATLTATISFGGATPVQVKFPVSVPAAYPLATTGDTKTFALTAIPSTTGITGINGDVNQYWDPTSDIKLTQAASGWTIAYPRKADGSTPYVGFFFTWGQVFLAGTYTVEVDLDTTKTAIYTGLYVGAGAAGAWGNGEAGIPDGATGVQTIPGNGKVTATVTLPANGYIYIGRHPNSGNAALGSLSAPSADPTYAFQQVIVTHQ